MPKRSRYWNAFFQDGIINIIANKQLYTFTSIEKWTFAEITNKFNPEEIDYAINVFYPGGDILIVCSDQEECSAIVEDLQMQRI